MHPAGHLPCPEPHNPPQVSSGSDGVSVGVLVGVKVGVAVGVDVAAGVDVGVSVGVNVGVRVGVGVGVVLLVQTNNVLSNKKTFPPLVPVSPFGPTGHKECDAYGTTPCIKDEVNDKLDVTDVCANS